MRANRGMFVRQASSRRIGQLHSVNVCRAMQRTSYKTNDSGLGAKAVIPASSLFGGTLVLSRVTSHENYTHK